MNSDIYLNGNLVGSRPYGYSTIVLDLTPYITSDGSDNVLAVRVNNFGSNSRWYAGSGIFRPVELVVQPPVHLATWSTSVLTPVVTNQLAKLRIQTTVNNTLPSVADAQLALSIKNSKGDDVATAHQTVKLQDVASTNVTFDVSVNQPSLWSPESPNLYYAHVTVTSGQQSDSVTEEIGS